MPKSSLSAKLRDQMPVKPGSKWDEWVEVQNLYGGSEFVLFQKYCDQLT